MEYVIKSKFPPEEIATITPEIVANQRIGTRIAFRHPHDITVEFGKDHFSVDDIDTIIHVVPYEFFCYRKDETVGKFHLECRGLEMESTGKVGAARARAALRGLQK